MATSRTNTTSRLVLQTRKLGERKVSNMPKVIQLASHSQNLNPGTLALKSEVLTIARQPASVSWNLGSWNSKGFWGDLVHILSQDLNCMGNVPAWHAEALKDTWGRTRVSVTGWWAFGFPWKLSMKQECSMGGDHRKLRWSGGTVLQESGRVTQGRDGNQENIHLWADHHPDKGGSNPPQTSGTRVDMVENSLTQGWGSWDV